MPIDLTKDDKINLIKISSLLVIFETVSIGISILIYNQFKEIVYIVYIFGVIAPIFLCLSISYLMFRYRIFIKLYDEFFVITTLFLILTGIFLISILQNVAPFSSIIFLPSILLLISYGVFSWFTNKIVLFFANKYIKMSSPTTDILEEKTLFFRMDIKNTYNKINSLLILLEKIFDYHRLKDIDSHRWLLVSNDDTESFILIYIYKNTLLITPFENSIYEYNFKNSDIRQSISDLVISLFNFEEIDAATEDAFKSDFDEESSFAFSDYNKMFTKYSVKKSEIKELFPFAKIIGLVVIIIAAIVLLFLFYSKIPELFQYLQDIGVTPYIVSTIVISIILGVGNYLRKFFQKKIFKK